MNNINFNVLNTHWFLFPEIFFNHCFMTFFIDHFMWVALIPQLVRLRVIAQSLVHFDFRFWFPILRLLVRCSEFVKWIKGGGSQLRNRQATVNTLSPVHIKSVCLNIFMLWLKYNYTNSSGTKKTIEHSTLYKQYKHIFTGVTSISSITILYHIYRVIIGHYRAYTHGFLKPVTIGYLYIKIIQSILYQKK